MAGASGAAIGGAAAASVSRRLPSTSFEVGCGGGHDPILEGGRRLDRKQACLQHRHDAAELVELVVRLGARRQVSADRGHLVLVERAQHERRRQVDDLVVAEFGGTTRVGHGDNTRRIARRPRRIRLLTVPSGVPVRSAISTWVSPPK